MLIVLQPITGHG